MAPKQKQSSIASFFSAAGPKRKPPGDGAAAAEPPAKRAAAGGSKPAAPTPPPRAPPPSAAVSLGAAELGPLEGGGALAVADIPGRDHRRHARLQAKLVGAVGAGSLAEPAGKRAAAGGGGGGGARPKYTPLEEQVVALKQKHKDALLLVEVGYKGRFFGEDAEAASRVLGLHAYPDHNFLTASIPVQRIPVHVRRLVQAGYKVGIVRQTETVALKSVSSNRSAPFERELTALYTAATFDAGERADKIGEEGAMEASQELDALMAQGGSGGGSYLMVVAEGQAAGGTAARGGGADGDRGGGASQAAAGSQGGGGDEGGDTAVGIVAVDAAAGDVVYGTASSGGLVQSGLEAALAALAPSEVVALEPLSPGTLRLLERYAGGGQGGGGGSGGGARSARLVRVPGSPYLDNAALARLSALYAPEEEGGQGEAAAGGSGGGGGGGGGSAPGGGAAVDFVLALPPLVLRALSGAVGYLDEFGLSGALLEVGAFRPLAGAAGLALSSNAMRQLELMTTVEGSFKGSLLHLLDRTATGFGSRLLRRWVAAPLADRGLITERLDAVEELVAAPSGVLASLPAELRRLPDIERSFMRMAHGTASPSEAVAALAALRQLPERLGIRIPSAAPSGGSGGAGAPTAAEAAAAAAAKSPLLVRLLAEALSPAATGAASKALLLVDEAAARANDYESLFRSRERFPEVFERAEAVAAADAHLLGLLPQLARAAGVGRLSYVSIQNQGDWMVELPASRTSVPAGWERVCATKKVARYLAPEIRAAATRLAVAREQRQAACRAAWASLLAEFAKRHHATCRRAVCAAAHLDALCALAAVAQSPGYSRPHFVDEGAAPRLAMTAGRHPTLDLGLQGGAVPNDLDLAWDGVRAAVVTGPNAGGKSVFLRTAAVLAVMAHVGSYVPADRLELSAMDAVLTRMGAADDLATGRSTFAEEIANAAEMVNRATPRTLVVLDELGRGTATLDGIAVASATLSHLVNERQALTLFTTHYPELWREFEGGGGGGRVRVWHTAYRQQGQGEGEEAQGQGQGQEQGAPPGAAASGPYGEGTAAPPPPLVFLYRVEPGGAAHSFGLNVARIAGLPAPVVARAAGVAARLGREAAAGAADAAGAAAEAGGEAATGGPLAAAAAAPAPPGLLSACHLVVGAVKAASAGRDDTAGYSALQRAQDVARAALLPA